MSRIILCLSCGLTLLGFALPGCAPSGPHVSVARTGALFPARPADCSLKFLNGEHIAIAADYAHLGLINLNGTHEQVRAARDAIPAAVQEMACEAGADAVSLNLAMASGSGQTIQFSMWRSLESTDEPPPAPPHPSGV